MKKATRETLINVLLAFAAAVVICYYALHLSWLGS